MKEADVFIAGLPSAGKTTFLAALWHLVMSHEIKTALAYAGLEGIDVGYLNDIRAKWLAAEQIGRTRSSTEKVAQINLKSRGGDLLRLRLPDYAGESFKRMWERRFAATHVAEAARSATGHLLLINIERVAYPQTADEFRAQLEGTGPQSIELKPFEVANCPTAAILADVISSLETLPIAADPPRTALCLTAWDAVADEGLSPEQQLRQKLPLIAQMVDARAGERQYRVYGISAQGADYEGHRSAVLEFDQPSQRITVRHGKQTGHDLTLVLEWLLG